MITGRYLVLNRNTLKPSYPFVNEYLTVLFQAHTNDVDKRPLRVAPEEVRPDLQNS